MVPLNMPRADVFDAENVTLRLTFCPALIAENVEGATCTNDCNSGINRTVTFFTVADEVKTIVIVLLWPRAISTDKFVGFQIIVGAAGADDGVNTIPAAPNSVTPNIRATKVKVCFFTV